MHFLEQLDVMYFITRSDFIFRLSGTREPNVTTGTSNNDEAGKQDTGDQEMDLT